MMAVDLDHLSKRDFTRLAKFIHDYSGIKMPESKKTMVEGRLRARVAATGSAHLTEYCRRLFDEGGLAEEIVPLIDVVTTNKTEFFREPEHFRFLDEMVLPQLVAGHRGGLERVVKVWCTASSVGAEPYTLAMVLAEASERLGGFRFSIVATDISERVLKTALMAIYPEAMIAPVPIPMRKRYLLQGKKSAQRQVRIVPQLRKTVQFGRLNLMDTSYPMDRDCDVIFCRNTLIYFDKPTQQAVVSRLCDHLRQGGYLFLGHSESLAGTGLPLKPVGPSTFLRE